MRASSRPLTHAFAFVALALVATACGPKTASEAMPQSTDRPAQTSTLAPLFSDRGAQPKTLRKTYDLSAAGCETGFHVAYGLAEYCQNLQIDYQNNNTHCSIESRKAQFNKDCGRLRWDSEDASQRLTGQGKPHFFCRLYDGADSNLQISGTGFLEIRTRSGKVLYAKMKRGKASRNTGHVAVALSLEVLAADGSLLESKSSSWTQMSKGPYPVNVGPESNPVVKCIVNAKN